MKITAIRIRVLANTGNKMVGLSSITLENMIAIHDIKILNNQNELFLAMPSRSTKAGTFKDVVHPINASVRETIERIVFRGYEKCLRENIANVQYELKSDFLGVLTEQTLDDFILVYSNGHVDDVSSGQQYKSVSKPKGTDLNAFIDDDLSRWLEG